MKAERKNLLCEMNIKLRNAMFLSLCIISLVQYVSKFETLYQKLKMLFNNSFK